MLKTYEYCDNDQGDVHGSGVKEGRLVRDIDTSRGTPLSHFHQGMLLQLQEIKLELNASTFLELYRTAQTLQFYLEVKWVNVFELEQKRLVIHTMKV